MASELDSTGAAGCSAAQRRPKASTAPAQDGFTLLEVLLAVGITAMVMLTVHMTFMGTIQASVEMESLSEDREPGPRILAMIERDLNGLWHANIKKNRVLRGRNLDIGGPSADRIDFLTTTDATGIVLDSIGKPRRASVCEVGYWLRQNPDTPGLLELWRREDPMIDDNLIAEGQFQLVHDRLKSFNIKYYATLGYEAEELNEWDSSIDDTLPRRILIEFTLERKVANRNRTSGEVGDDGPVERTYSRYIVLDPRYPEILKPGVALMPTRPGQPTAAAAGGGGPGGPQAGGGGGPGSAGGAVGEAGEVNTKVGIGGDGARSGRGNRGGNRGGGNRGGPPAGGPPPGGNSGTINIGDLLRGGAGRGGGNGLFGGIGQGGGGGRR